jgi:hypothetical protein
MTVAPKTSRSTLDLLNNMYVVKNGLVYDYYSISVKPGVHGKFMFFDVSPAIIQPGIAIVGKAMYDVSLPDLLRRKINVGNRRQPAVIKPIEPTSKTTISSGDTKTSDPIQCKDESRTGIFVGDEESEAVDLAWEEQVGTLLEAVHPKKRKLKTKSTPQSGFPDKDGTV